MKDLDEDFIRVRILEYLAKSKVDLDNEKSKSYKLMFKFLRKKLRETYGAFRDVKETRNLDFYKEIFNKFKPKSVLDLGCGLEPLNYTTIYPNVDFYCLDINKKEVKEINEFLKKNNVKGKAFVFSLVDDNLSKLPQVDLCLILRVLESLESIKRNFSKELLSKIGANVIIASFAKKALGKKIKIRKSGRAWFRRILKRLCYNYEILDYDNEIVFVIKK